VSLKRREKIKRRGKEEKTNESLKKLRKEKFRKKGRPSSYHRK
jgi:hypothetical protein